MLASFDLTNSHELVVVIFSRSSLLILATLFASSFIFSFLVHLLLLLLLLVAFDIALLLVKPATVLRIVHAFLLADLHDSNLALVIEVALRG